MTVGKNFSGPPSTESSALENYPLPKTAGHRKKRLGPGGIACVIGATTLVVACAATFLAVRFKQSHVFPVTKARGETPECILQVLV